MIEINYPNQSSYVLVQRYKNSMPVIGELTKITANDEYMVRFDIKDKSVKISSYQILLHKVGNNSYNEISEYLKCWSEINNSLKDCMLNHKWD